MYLSTFAADVGQGDKRILENIPLLLKNKKTIWSSYLLYNIKTGFYTSANIGLKHNQHLYLGDIINLWEQEESPWHFYDSNRQEIFCYKIDEVRTGLNLCFAWQMQSNSVCAYVLEDAYEGETYNTTTDMLRAGRKPHQPAHRGNVNISLVDSIYSADDLIESLIRNRSINRVFKERQDNRAFSAQYGEGKMYLYPKGDKDTDFYLKKCF